MRQWEGLTCPVVRVMQDRADKKLSLHSLAMTAPEVMLEFPDIMLLEKY